jgi:hypothetical protein
MKVIEGEIAQPTPLAEDRFVVFPLVHRADLERQIKLAK